MSPSPKTAEVTWENLISPEQWRVYACVLNEICSRGVPFALGGGLALGYYTEHLRRSKDLDIYVRLEKLGLRIGIVRIDLLSLLNSQR